MNIASVDAIAVRAECNDAKDLDGSTETVVVCITDEAGRVGIGETDAPARAIQELVLMDDAHLWSRGLAGMLIGKDPFEIRALYDDLYNGTIYHARRGLGIHALSAIDIALHDLVGKQLERPAFQLLGGARRDSIVPYATLYAGRVNGRTIAEMMSVLGTLIERAIELQFKAVKVEVLFEKLVSDRHLVECIRETRRILGTDIALLIDFGYRWSDWRDALWVLRRVEDCDLYLAEATLHHDDLIGHKRLGAAVETRIGGAEMAATVFECKEWLEVAGVDVLQPDINRCGGLTEMRRIAELASFYGATVIPHGWKTGITAAAARHFQAATPNAPYIEMFVGELFSSALRSELVYPEPELSNGTIELPQLPGLGVELSADVIEKYRVDVML